MKSWHAWWKRAWSDDSLAQFRDRIAQQLSLFSALLLLPFTINHLVDGRLALGICILLAQAVLAVNGYRLRQGRAVLVPMWAMVLAFHAAILGAVMVQGVNSVFWAFPALFIGYFLLPRKQAHVISVAITLAVPAVVLAAVGPAAAVRALAALVLTLAMLNVVLGVIADLQQALMKQASTDALTGAWNRRHFDAQLALMRPPPDPGRTPNVLLALDIDHFKAVNDQHGHGVGDEVLKNLVKLVVERKRETDQLFRIGGEEFVLLLPRTGLVAATAVAEDLRRRIEATDLVPGLRVTVSIGLSVQAPSHIDQPWLAAADEALYEAKRQGRNRVVVATTGAWTALQRQEMAAA